MVEPALTETLAGFINFRPVGSPELQSGYRLKMYRSNTSEHLTPAERDKAALLLDLVVDLRDQSEREAHPHPLACETGYRSLPYHDADLLRPLPPGIPDLLSLYIEGASTHRRTLRAVFTALADAPTSRILICCAAGKDRTGVISALLARLRGATDQTVAEDYATTAIQLADLFRTELATTIDPEFTHAMQRTAPSTMTSFVAHIEQTYGSVTDYLSWLGLNDQQIANLVQPADESE